MAEAQAFHCPATLDDVRALAAFVQGFMEQEGVSDEARIDLELALVEAANNIVVHGYSGAPGHEIMAYVRRMADGIEIELEDGGRPIPAELLDSTAPAGLSAESGRGLGLMAACTDRIDYACVNGRNRLVMFKAMAFPASQGMAPPTA